MYAETSRMAFHQTVHEREAQAYRLLGVYLLGAKSDREASYILGWERAAVSARRNDLIKQGRVVNLGKKKDKDTNKEVTVWGVPKETLW